MIDPLDPLSPAGLERREEILLLARGAARRRRVRRNASRAAAMGLSVLLIGGGLVVHMVRVSHPVRSPHPVAQAPIPVPPAPSKVSTPPKPAPDHITIAAIRTDPTITARLSVGHPRPRWKTIGDEELLQSLAEAGKPSGLIETDGRKILLSR